MFPFCSLRGEPTHEEEEVVKKHPPPEQAKVTLAEDKRVLALVRFLARRAAEKDYKELLEVLKANPQYGSMVAEEETKS